MVLPGFKTFIFFGIMAAVGIILNYSGLTVNDLPPEIQQLLTEQHITDLVDSGYKIAFWFATIGGFFFRLITKSSPLKK